MLETTGPVNKIDNKLAKCQIKMSKSVQMPYNICSLHLNAFNFSDIFNFYPVETASYISIYGHSTKDFSSHQYIPWENHHLNHPVFSF